MNTIIRQYTKKIDFCCECFNRKVYLRYPIRNLYMLNINQKVVCTKRGNWNYTNPMAAELYPEGCPFGPKFNEIVTIADIVHKNTGIYLTLFEYSNHTYAAKWFEPLIEDSVLEDELTKIFESISA